jgi:hypothetical protein
VFLIDVLVDRNIFSLYSPGLEVDLGGVPFLTAHQVWHTVTGVPVVEEDGAKVLVRVGLVVTNLGGEGLDVAIVFTCNPDALPFPLVVVPAAAAVTVLNVVVDGHVLGLFRPGLDTILDPVPGLFVFDHGVALLPFAVPVVDGALVLIGVAGVVANAKLFEL